MSKHQKKISTHIISWKKWKKLVAWLTAIGLFTIVSLVSDFFGILDHFSSKEPVKNISINFQPNLYIQSVTEQPTDLSQVNALYTQGKALFSQGDYENAIAAYEEALAKNTSIDINTARIQYATGLAYKYNSNTDKAISMYTKSLGTLQNLLEASANAASADISDEHSLSSEIAYVHYLRATAYNDKKDFQRALEECDICLTSLSDIPNGDYSAYHFSPASVYSLRGRIYASSYYSSHSIIVDMAEKDLGYTLEDALYSTDIAIWEKGAQFLLDDSEELSPDNTCVRAYNNLYFHYTLNPKYWFTEGIYVLSEKDAEMAEILTNRAAVLVLAGSFNEAIEDCEAALKIYENLPFSEQYNIYRTYLYLAYSKLYNGFNEDGSISETAIADCNEYIDKALNHNRAWYGENHFITAISYENMGAANSLSGKYTEAIKNHKTAKRIFKKLGLKEDAKKQNYFIKSLKIVRAAGGGEWKVNIISYHGYIEYEMYFQLQKPHT